MFALVTGVQTCALPIYGGAGAESAATRATDALGGTLDLLHPESRHHAVLAGGGPGSLWVALRLYPVQRAGCRAQSARRRIGFNPACIQKSLCAARNSSTATRHPS